MSVVGNIPGNFDWIDLIGGSGKGKIFQVI